MGASQPGNELPRSGPGNGARTNSRRRHFGHGRRRLPNKHQATPAPGPQGEHADPERRGVRALHHCRRYVDAGERGRDHCRVADYGVGTTPGTGCNRHRGQQTRGHLSAQESRRGHPDRDRSNPYQISLWWRKAADTDPDRHGSAQWRDSGGYWSDVPERGHSHRRICRYSPGRAIDFPRDNGHW